MSHATEFLYLLFDLQVAVKLVTAAVLLGEEERRGLNVYRNKWRERLAPSRDGLIPRGI